MREFRVIAAIALVALVFVIAGLISVDVFTDHDGMDRTASRHIEQICGFQRDCKVRIGDLVPGNWDTFYEFGVGVPQGEVDRVLGPNRVDIGDLQRLLVLTRNGKVISNQLESDALRLRSTKRSSSTTQITVIDAGSYSRAILGFA